MLLPVERRAVLVMRLQRLFVVDRFVPEDRTAGIELAAIADQYVPEVMADFMPKMPKHGAVGLAHLQSPPLALEIIGLGQRDGDDPVVVARHHLGTVLPIGEKIEDQTVYRIFQARPQRQFPAQQRIKQPVLAEFEFTPAGEFGGVGKIGNDAVMTAGHAIKFSRGFRYQPVASIIVGIGAKKTRRALRSNWTPAIAIGFKRRHLVQFGLKAQPMTALPAGAIF